MFEQPKRIDRDPYVRLLFRQLPGALWTTDRELRLTYVAGRSAKNLQPRAKPGMSIYEVLGTDDPANPVIARHRAALAGESQSFEYEFLGRWHAVFIEQLVNDDGTVAGCVAAAFDVTEERATKERLARSEALLGQAQRVAHIGSFELDIASNLVTWSDELYRIYGLEPGGQFGGGTYDAYLEHIHPDDVERAKSMLFDALRTGGPFVNEYRIIRADGATRVLYTRGEVMKNENGQTTRVAGCCWDVTELKDAMANLEHARSLLEATIDATADGLLVVDLQGTVTTYNERFLSLWQIPLELVRERDDAKLLAFVCGQLEDPSGFMWSTQELYSHPDRESFDVLHFNDGRVFERYSRPQRTGGQIAGRVWSFRDVTDRERLLRRALFLSDAARLLGSLDVEPALDGVARMAVPYMGDVCAVDLLGSGQPRRLLVVSRQGTESFNPELHKSILAGRPAIYTLTGRSCMAVPLIVKGAVAGAMTFVGSRGRRYNKRDLEFAQELASRAALSVENARLYREAQEALQARDEFLAIAAHEIRGPITSVHMAVQGLRKGKVSPAATPRVLEIIEREDRRLARFVEELLDLGRIQSGKIHFNFEEVDLGEVVRSAASSLSSELTKSGSALSITTEGRPVGQWDRFRLDQVVTNLLSNAIKFGNGQPISVSVREHQGLTTLKVTDQGIGIQPEMLDRVFQPFGRAVSSRHYGGLGLGLFIARTIVEGLGGTIRVESKPNAGSIFTVELRDGGIHEEDRSRHPDSR